MLKVVASSVVDIDPDTDGLANASLSFEQFDVIIPKQRLETFDIAIMTERGPFTNDVGNFMECSFHDKQMIGSDLILLLFFQTLALSSLAHVKSFWLVFTYTQMRKTWETFPKPKQLEWCHYFVVWPQEINLRARKLFTKL